MSPCTLSFDLNGMMRPAYSPILFGVMAAKLKPEQTHLIDKDNEISNTGLNNALNRSDSKNQLIGINKMMRKRYQKFSF